MKLSEIDATLREIRVSPVKTLGQNFLHDGNLARWIVEKAELTPDDYVVEIGPGLGALTSLALAIGCARSRDRKGRRLADFLRKRFTSPRLEVLHADALDFDVRSLFAQPRVKLFRQSSLLHFQSAALEVHENPSPISLWLFMLQKEMARRLSASPGTSDYGALTLMVQSHYRVDYLRTVPASVFLPQPDVDSAFVRLIAERARRIAGSRSRTFSPASSARFFATAQAAAELASGRGSRLGRGLDTRSALSRERARRNFLSSSGSRFRISSVHRSFRMPSQGRVRSVFRWWTSRTGYWGTRRAGEVHGNNLRHRAVHILVFNNLGELFLQKRSRWKDRHPRRWDSSAAGHVDAGEEYDVAANRELARRTRGAAELERVVPNSRRRKKPVRNSSGSIRRGTMVHSNWLAPRSSTANFSRPASFQPGCRLGRMILRPDSSNAGGLTCSTSDDSSAADKKPLAAPSLFLLPCGGNASSLRRFLPRAFVRLLRSAMSSSRQIAHRYALKLSGGPTGRLLSAMHRIAEQSGYRFPSAKEVDLKTVRLFLGAWLCVDATDVRFGIGISSFSHEMLWLTQTLSKSSVEANANTKTLWMWQSAATPRLFSYLRKP